MTISAPAESRRTLGRSVRTGGLLTLVLLGLAAAGLWVYEAESRSVRRDIERNLETTALLKVDQIARWRRERLGDAAALGQNLPFIEEARGVLAGGGQEAKGRLLVQLWFLLSQGEYVDALVVDPRGRVLLSVKTESGRMVSAETIRTMAHAFQQRAAELTDVHVDGDGTPVHLDVVTPVFAGTAAAETAGAVLLRCLAGNTLYDLTGTWPTASDTAETLLVRGDGSDVVFLSPLRHDPDARIPFRLPARAPLPAAQAVLGAQGLISGQDYRGVEVLANAYPVPDSPWVVLAKIDVSEALRPVNARVGLVVGLLVSVVVASASLFVALGAAERRSYYRQRYEAERARAESEQRFVAMFELAAIGLAQADPATGRWLRVNQKLCAITGYTTEEMLALRVMDIAHPDDREADWNAFQRVVRGEAPDHRLEERYVRKDGSERWVSVNMTILRDPAGQPLRAMVAIEDISDRKHAERALRESEAFTRAVLDNLPIGVAVNSLDPAVLFSYMNDNFPRIYRTTREALSRPDGFWEAVYEDPAFRAETRSRVLADCASGDPTRMHWEDVPLVRQGEETTFVSARDIPVPGQPFVISTVWDVTAIRRAESALSRLAEQRQLALDAAHLGWWHYDALTRMSTFDERYAQICGVAGDTAPIDQIFALVHPDDRSQVTAAVAAALDPVAARPYTSEHRILTSAGATRWVEAHGAAVFEGHGPARRATGLVGTLQDITDRKQAQQALLLANERMRRFIDSDVVGVVVANAAGKVLQANDHYLRLVGCTRDELNRGEVDWRAITPPEWLPADERALAELQARGICTPYEKEYVRRDGSRVPVFLGDAMLPGPNEEIAAFALDLTDLKRAEAEVRTLNEELERRVAERTAQLEAANHELEAFAYSVSHDLRAPLRGIDGWSLALLEDCADRIDATGRGYLDRVRREAQRMGRLIDDLLKLSRVTRAEMQRSRVDLSEMVETIAARLLASEPGRAVEFVIAPGLCADGDPLLLEAALTNLLENAWKFSAGRTPARIEFGRTGPERPDDAFFVRDNGAGFDMAHASKLFGAFQRLHRSSEFPGTGIGLASVQRIVHRHGGRIWAEASVGGGATFYFRLGDPA